jgi:hypothetical protein
MTTALREALSAGDREHIRALLNSSITETAQAETISKVAVFLRERTLLDAGGADAFRALSPSDREELLSELIWRLTCHLDGSQTATLGINRHALSSAFSAVITDGDGGGFCTLVLNS